MCWMGVGGVKVCVRTTFGMSEGIRKFLYNEFGVSSCEYTTSSMYECVGIK